MTTMLLILADYCCVSLTNAPGIQLRRQHRTKKSQSQFIHKHFCGCYEEEVTSGVQARLELPGDEAPENISPEHEFLQKAQHPAHMNADYSE